MNKLNKLGAVVLAVASGLSLSAGQVFAQEVTLTTLAVSTGIGSISSVAQVVIFILNLFTYLGWVGVVIGVGLAIFGLVYKLINTDSEEAMKTVQGYLTKAVLIVAAGILLIGSGFIIKTVAGFVPGFIAPTVVQQLNVE